MQFVTVFLFRNVLNKIKNGRRKYKYCCPFKNEILSDFIISLFLHNAEHARSYAYSTIKEVKCHRCDCN